MYESYFCGSSFSLICDTFSFKGFITDYIRVFSCSVSYQILPICFSLWKTYRPILRVRLKYCLNVSLENRKLEDRLLVLKITFVHIYNINNSSPEYCWVYPNSIIFLSFLDDSIFHLSPAFNFQLLIIKLNKVLNKVLIILSY